MKQPQAQRLTLRPQRLDGPRGGPSASALDGAPKTASFAAIDFETADYGSDSACAVGVVRVEGGRIAKRYQALIRPPRSAFQFTYIHGITWEQVSLEPTFGQLWPRLREAIGEVQFLAAHNARFDRKVLETCCLCAQTALPRLPFVCTVELARRTWKIFPTKLPMVCEHLGIELNHHQALSDAEACARIVLAALETGWRHDSSPARTA